MDLKQLGRNWDAWGKKDAMYAVLTDPSKRHNKWDKDEFFATGRQEIADVLAYLKGLNVEVRTHAALDFGCGVGRLSQALAETFESVTGVDIAPSMVEQATAHNRHGDRCRYVVNAAGDLSQFATGSIDFVYSNIVLQHMQPEFAHAYVREFFRILRPGGIAVFFLPEAPAESTYAAPSARTRVKGLIGRVANGLSYGVGGKMVVPQIDMYGTPRAEAEKLVRDAGATVLDVVADSSAGDGWTGYRYCCQAASASA